MRETTKLKEKETNNIIMSNSVIDYLAEVASCDFGSLMQRTAKVFKLVVFQSQSSHFFFLFFTLDKVDKKIR